MLKIKEKFTKKNIVKLSVMAVALALLIVGNVVCGIYSGMITMAFGGYKTDFSKDGVKTALAASDELCRQIIEEGAVLLKNENSALPVKDTNKINLFGWGSSSLMYSSRGSGAISSYGKKMVTLTDAFTAEGLEYNESLIKKYVEFCPGSKGATTLIEPDKSFYTKELIDEAKAFSSVAVVVLVRGGGENIGGEIPRTQTKFKYPADETRTYLQTSKEEDDLIEIVKENFERVIVIVNTANIMHLDFADDEKVDSVLFVGTLGQSGAASIPKILKGTVSPSGRTTDTYIYDPTFDPSYANQLRYKDNIQYVEDIYMGYKWFETADKAGFWTSDYAKNKWGITKGYEQVVQYPFGHGLSYTTFEKKITAVSLPENSTLKLDDEIEITVEVTNTGSVSGKDVVELYYTAPYYENGIEKSAVNLADFAKTETLKPGQFQEVKLTVSAYDMASFDCYDKNGNGFKGYELEAGEYFVKIMENAHESSKIAELKYNVAEGGLKFRRDTTTKKPIRPYFTGESAYSGVPIDGSTVGAEKVYLTRSDFAGSFPVSRAAVPTETKLVEQANGYRNELFNITQKPTFGVDSGLRIVTLENGSAASLTDLNGDGGQLKYNDDLAIKLGLDYNAPEWETLLSQLTVDEVCDLVEQAGYKTIALASVGKTFCIDLDGPAGFGTANTSPTFRSEWTGYPGATIIGCTWNKNIALAMGLTQGAEAAQTSVNGWYAPGVNLHRSQYNARNSEYYGEDGVLSGKLAAEVIRGAKTNGLYCYLKHFALSEPGVNAVKLNTWITEQNLRETYLKPFEICVKEGGANAMMSAFNRVGGTWAGASYPLLEKILRVEWGFKGTIVTDWSQGDDYMHPTQGLLAGNDIWLNPATIINAINRSDPTVLTRARNSAKNVLYTYCNTYAYAKTVDKSALTGVVDVGIKSIESTKPWWIAILVAIDVTALAVIVWRCLLIFLPKKPRPGAAAVASVATVGVAAAATVGSADSSARSSAATTALNTATAIAEEKPLVSSASSAHGIEPLKAETPQDKGVVLSEVSARLSALESELKEVKALLLSATDNEKTDGNRGKTKEKKSEK